MIDRATRTLAPAAINETAREVACAEKRAGLRVFRPGSRWPIAAQCQHCGYLHGEKQCLTSLLS